jgi:tetratricopeptide (TPR) repeat protein
MATRVHPDALYFLHQGNTEWHFKHYNNAIAAYTEAIRIQEDYESAYYERGNAYFEKGEYDNAIADFEKLLKISPYGYSEATKLLAQAKAKSPRAIAAAAAAEQKEREAKVAKAAAEQREREAFRQRYKETTGKDINLSDVVKDDYKWAYVEDVKEAFRQEYNKTHGKDISLSDVVWDSGKWAYDGDVKAAKAAAEAKAKQKRVIRGIIGGICVVIGGIFVYNNISEIMVSTLPALWCILGFGIICGGIANCISNSVGKVAGRSALIGIGGGIPYAILADTNRVSAFFAGAFVLAIVGLIMGLIIRLIIHIISKNKTVHILVGGISILLIIGLILKSLPAQISAHTSREQTTEMPEAQQSLKTRVTTDTGKLLPLGGGKYETLRLRSDPSTSAKAIGNLQRGTDVEILEEGEYATIKDNSTGENISGKWVKIRGGGNEGWCFSGYLDPY